MPNDLEGGLWRNTRNKQKQTNAAPSLPADTQRYICTGWSRESPTQPWLLVYNFVMPFIAIATVTAVGFALEMKFIFPSLGPTAFLHFALPGQPAASPKNTLVAHLIGIIAGVFSLLVTGVWFHEQNTLQVIEQGVPVAWDRIFCAAISVALTCCCMLLFKVPHPPAGATTLIVSLGILKKPTDLMVIMAAVLVLTIEAFVINRIFRTDIIYPIWSVPSGQTKQHKLMSLKEKLTDLTVDNFVECYVLCMGIEEEEMRGIMNKLLPFAVDNHQSLNQRTDYRTKMPYAVHYLVEYSHRMHISRLTSQKVEWPTAKVASANEPYVWSNK
eukprot:506789_1